MNQSISGILLIDKPSGITSFKAVEIVKRKLQVKKAGHTGTLDPLATGLLMVLFGKATKLQSVFLKKDKTYKTKIRLGLGTDTDDITGKVINSGPSDISETRLGEVLNTFQGRISQTPPQFSAIKIAGKKMYDLARKGIAVDIPPRQVHIHSIEILSFEGNSFDIMVKCSSGTYIRSLARDIGKALGTFAVVEELVRTEIHPFMLSDAVGEKYLCNCTREELLNKSIAVDDINAILTKEEKICMPLSQRHE